MPLKDAVQPPMSKQVMSKSSSCEATHMNGQWHISLLAFNILIKYQHFDQV